jgi:L-asparaginase
MGGSSGIVDEDRIIVSRRPVLDREHIPTKQLEERIDIIKLVAGVDGRFINFALDDGARGLVIEALGRGNVTVATLPANRASDRRAPASRNNFTLPARPRTGHLRLRRWRQTVEADDAILGSMLPSHKARIKLMVMLGAGLSVDHIRVSFEA